jgi:hypothetical protein
MCKKCGKAKCACKPTKAADKKQDAKTMKGMSPAEKAKFAKEDKKMDKKPMSKAMDAKKDAALAKKVKKK